MSRTAILLQNSTAGECSVTFRSEVEYRRTTGRIFFHQTNLVYQYLAPVLPIFLSLKQHSLLCDCSNKTADFYLENPIRTNQGFGGEFSSTTKFPRCEAPSPMFPVNSGRFRPGTPKRTEQVSSKAVLVLFARRKTTFSAMARPHEMLLN